MVRIIIGINTATLPRVEDTVGYWAEEYANATWPIERVIERAVSLTVECLDVPAVWQCVRAVTDRLQVERTLRRRDLEPLCAPVRGMVERMPKWRRRFLAFVQVNREWKEWLETSRSPPGAKLGR